jgi:non-ribosomal peptide synthetase-like protein
VVARITAGLSSDHSRYVASGRGLGCRGLSWMNNGLDEAQRAPGRSFVAGVALPSLLRDETLVDIFRASAARVPAKVALALIGTDQRLTYEELDQRSDQVAAALAARGVKRGDFVGLWLKRSLELHVALLGILKAGAAYIPFDAEAPADRVAGCLADCGARLLVSHADHASETAKLSSEVAPIEALLSAGAVTGGITPALPDDPAYAIYTSGSTGKPKGIVITHRNICHYLRAGNEALGFRESDVVLQQASVAFDLSLEEIFVPYLVGATLKVATMETVKQTDRLPEIIEAEGITVIDTVPTLLSMFERDVPSLRVIVLGGEACPPALVDRFAKPGRFLFNTYGPTETTVVATYAELKPGDPVTIGKPIANYTAYVVDDQMNLLPAGETGELAVGGPGVTRGYINLPEMTAKKFVANPWDPHSARDPVLYRTGDAVSLDPQGRFAFHGRIDDQVKIRGYRIELGEIESLITDAPGVRTAAVAVHQHPTAGETLVAHVVSAEGKLDIEAAKKALAAKVPPYMVPPVWQLHETLPRLASGKVDRKSLSAMPITPVVVDQGEQEAPRTPTEAKLLAAAKSTLGLPVVNFDSDFFTDLGGHSLIAARFVSELRKQPELASIALQDMYSLRTLRKIGVTLDERAAGAGKKVDLSFDPPPLWKRFLCGLGQLIALPFIIAIVTAQWMGLLLSSIYLVRDETPLLVEVAILCSIYVSLNIGAKLLVIVLKWLVIGRTKPGVYPLWGWYYYRLWLMQRIIHLTQHKFLQGTPLMRIYLRALGAKVGRDAIINEFEEGAIDLVTFGDRASLGSKVKLANVEVVGNLVYVGRIEIGADAHIGNGCVIGHDTRLGEGCELGDLTAIAPGSKLGDWEHWDGTPARKIGMVDKASLPEHPELSQRARIWQGIGYFLSYNLIMMIGLLPIFPAFYVLYNIDNWTSGDYDYVIPWHMVPIYAWPAALALVFVSMGVAVVMRWILLPDRVQPGSYSIFSGFYFRKWMLGVMVESVLETLNSLYATMFMRNWYRLMGCKLGRGTEISANFAGRYDLIEMGQNNFIGDQTIFGDEDIHRGWMTLKRLKTGDRVFFGNNSVIAQGSVIEDDALIGVKSRMPEGLNVKAGETWFGSPAIKLPTRQKVVLAGNWTYEPPRRMRLWRLCFEAMHTSFPTAVLITIAYITADMIAAPIDRGDYWTAVGIFMAAGIINSLIMYSLSVSFKWLAMGIYRPIMKPMWSWWAMRTEAVAVFYGGLSSKVLLEYLKGTPFLPWVLRPYGMKTGKGIYINSTDLTEFDCIKIGDFSAINMQAEIQTHLYEDRVMKVGRIDIGNGVTVGAGTTILYDTKIEDWVQVGPLSLLMKGETLPGSSVWSGSPTQPMPINPHAVAQRRTGTIASDKEKALAAE